MAQSTLTGTELSGQQQSTPTSPPNGVLIASAAPGFHNYADAFAHIKDRHERQRLALAEIDKAPFGWYHVLTIVTTGIGFMTDSFDIFAINIAMSMIAYVYFGTSVEGDGSIPPATNTLIKVSTSVGTVIGQLFFGWIADVVGRKSIYGTELMIITAATVGQTLIGDSPACSFVGTLVFWRVVMGIGIGGDYPLSSIITSEFATTKWRGAIMGAVFANQGWGQLLGGIVSVLCVVAWKDTLVGIEDISQCTGHCILAMDRMWRILVGFGAVPAVAALYFRLTIPETPRYAFTQEVRDTDSNVTVKSVDEDAAPKASWSDFCTHFGQWKHGKILLGTAGSWFMLDVAYYGLGLNNSVILSTIGYAGQTNVYYNLYNTCVGNLIITCAGAIPGYWASVLTIDTIGRKPIQIGGFILLTFIFSIIGFAYSQIGQRGLLALYVLAQFFSNWGPNSTTFIVPGEVFPTRYRSTAHGMSAAAGKIGAILAQCVIGPLISHACPTDKPNCALDRVMQIYAGFMFLGILTSCLVPETKRKTLEELAETYHGEVNVPKRRYEDAAAATLSKSEYV